MNIQFAQEVELRLTEEAREAGIAVQKLVTRIVEERLSLLPNFSYLEDDWEALLHSQTVIVPAISPEALRRENLYGEED